MMLLMFKATGERLLENEWVRCKDVVSCGRHVFVGYFFSGGFDFSSDWDGFCVDLLGLAPSRKVSSASIKKQVSRPVKTSKIIKAISRCTKRAKLSLVSGILFFLGVFASFGVFVLPSYELFLLGFLFLFIGTYIRVELATEDLLGPVIMFLLFPLLCLVVLIMETMVDPSLFGPIPTDIALESDYYLMVFSLDCIISCGLIYACSFFNFLIK